MFLFSFYNMSDIYDSYGLVFNDHHSFFYGFPIFLGIKEHYNETDSNGVRYTWDFLQTRLKCCGVTEYEDWHNIKAWPGLSKKTLDS